ncbi:hypothetical protein [Spiroplasma taiwanense]|uniref:ECF transporter S component n=1 Tax=Spiroplasma taiwanense CT-1 TaxID=1276220 RepID=S5MGQ5_9MOLU|nr:hypothetical protein [Spiroplasma taiwanense]AGR41030.1 hypothetical protein STAIW_v1c03800 [Spiroplasma taiwanense CT-1]
MKKTDELNQDIVAINTIDLEYEISKLNKTNKRARIKSETLKIALVSLLLSMSTAVSFINVIIPLFITSVNVGFALKYYIIAISFQVVGIYWGMTLGLLDGLLQFLIWGLSPLFRLTSAIGLMIWVVLFWLLYEKVFRIYNIENKYGKAVASTFASMIIFIFAPFSSAILNYIWTYIEYGNGYGIIIFFNAWLSFMIFDLFAIILFTLTTSRIQKILSRLQK